MKESGIRYNSEMFISYSDDQGKTWQKGAAMRAPLQWVSPHGPFLELPDGTICKTVYGTLTKKDSDCYAGCNGVFRSQDGGETWDDFSIAFRHGPKRPDDPQPEPRYSEIDIVPLPDGRWLGLSRT